MNRDSTDDPMLRRRMLGSVPQVLVHVAFVALVALTLIVLRRGGAPDPFRQVTMVLGVIALVATGGVVVMLSLTRHRWRVPWFVTGAFAAMFASNLCSLLARLPTLSGAARTLGVASGILSFVALPLALAGAWPLYRDRRHPG